MSTGTISDEELDKWISLYTGSLIGYVRATDDPEVDRDFAEKWACRCASILTALKGIKADLNTPDCNTGIIS